MTGYLPGPNRREIVCNFRVQTRTFCAGAQAWVYLTNPGNGSERIFIIARARGGRLVRKWEAIWRLKNFRVKTLVPEHPAYKDFTAVTADGSSIPATAEQAEGLNHKAQEEYDRRHPKRCP